MTEMVERVAEAIASYVHPERATSPNYWSKWVLEEDKVKWRGEARAAIRAMREPTVDILEAGPVEPYMDRDVWANMIDAALK